MGNPGGTANYLASDVLQLTGISVVNPTTGQTDAYGLSMSYSPGLIGSTIPFLATLMPNGYWMNAVNGNLGGIGVTPPSTPLVESLASFMTNNGLNSSSDLSATSETGVMTRSRTLPGRLLTSRVIRQTAITRSPWCPSRLRLPCWLPAPWGCWFMCGGGDSSRSIAR